MIEKGKINFNSLKVTCLDEADEMLKMGFQKDIETIFNFINKSTSSKTQNLLFSATFPDWVSQISKNYQS
jgi:superfamily II DNA/RNA helicase